MPLQSNSPSESQDVQKFQLDNNSTLSPKCSNSPFQQEIVWRNVIIFTFLHVGAVYGIYLLVLSRAVKPVTFLFIYLFGNFCGLGITAGAHRLWAHRSYKATLPMRILLLVCNTVAVQNSVITWARDHRLHHKHSETDADPHNIKRGFFFAHMGWLLVRKHPEIKAKGHTIDMNDLWRDPLLRFQHKYYLVLAILFGFIIPTYIPTLWGESKWNAFFVCGVLRYILSLHFTWLTNSVAHLWGKKSFDTSIYATENKAVSLLALGEGFHNYHHVFPWDYKTAELGDYSLNVSKLFIDIMAKIGWAYDLKTVSPDIIEKRVKRTGDGTHPVWGVNSANRLG